MRASSPIWASETSLLARLASLAQIGELARRLIFFKNNFHNKAKKVCIKTRSPSPSLPSIADMFSRTWCTWCTCMTPWFYFYISEFYDRSLRSLVIATQIFLDRERKRPARIYSLPTDSNRTPALRVNALVRLSLVLITITMWRYSLFT